jgi:hypothetical protein
MFERTRSELVKRLKALIDRFESIVNRARAINSDALQASRFGFPADQSVPLTTEIALKAEEQMGLCGESITHLLVDRSLPLIFKSGVSKAERFADQCEARLRDIDNARQYAGETFRARYGISG